MGVSHIELECHLWSMHNIIQMACQVPPTNLAKPGIFHIRVERGHYSWINPTNKGPHITTCSIWIIVYVCIGFQTPKHSLIFVQGATPMGKKSCLLAQVLVPSTRIKFHFGASFSFISNQNLMGFHNNIHYKVVFHSIFLCFDMGIHYLIFMGRNLANKKKLTLVGIVNSTSMNNVSIVNSVAMISFSSE